MAAQAVRISGYGDYKGKNYGKNAMRADVGRLSLWFSYSTCIAFEVEEPGHFTSPVVSQNCWGPTTGRHLNWIEDDKAKRLPRSEFEHRLNIALEELGVALPKVVQA